MRTRAHTHTPRQKDRKIPQLKKIDSVRPIAYNQIIDALFKKSVFQRLGLNTTFLHLLNRSVYLQPGPDKVSGALGRAERRCPNESISSRFSSPAQGVRTPVFSPTRGETARGAATSALTTQFTSPWAPLPEERPLGVSLE